MTADVEYERRYAIALQELKDSRIWRSSYLTLAHKVAKAVGFRSRPAHYNSYVRNALSMGLYFGVVWGLAMWVLQWSQRDLPISSILSFAAIAGILFGLCTASYYWFSAKTHALSKWDELDGLL